MSTAHRSISMGGERVKLTHKTLKLKLGRRVDRLKAMGVLDNSTCMHSSSGP